jgi:hypothetical protein
MYNQYGFTLGFFLYLESVFSFIPFLYQAEAQIELLATKTKKKYLQLHGFDVAKPYDI